MAEEKKFTTNEQEQPEKQAAPNADTPTSAAEQHQQQQQQQPPTPSLQTQSEEDQNPKPQSQEQPVAHSNEESKEPQSKVEQASQEAAGTTTTATTGLDMTALVSSITVPSSSILQDEPIQPAYTNGDVSEEDHMRISSKLSAHPDIPPSSISMHHATAIRCTAGEMEVAEMRVKIICQEKNIMALKMELKAAELQVEAKNKVDAKKTRLVELLDNKLSTVEGRNAKLLEMVEQMLKDKDANTNRLKEATYNMTDLSQRLIKSERHKTELMNANTELRKMLESLETKGSQIAKLALEKVTKYRDANELMQQELLELKDGAAAATAAAAASPPITEEMWGGLIQLQQQIAAALQPKEAGNVESLQQAIQAASEASTALAVSLEEVRQKLEQNLTVLTQENQQLRSLVRDFDTVRQEMEKKEEISRALLKDKSESVIAKDKEIEELKEELQRLKGAIGQLIGAK